MKNYWIITKNDAAGFLFCILPWCMLIFCTGNLNSTIEMVVIVLCTALALLIFRGGIRRINYCVFILVLVVVGNVLFREIESIVYCLSITAFCTLLLAIYNMEFSEKTIHTINTSMIMLGLIISVIGIFMPAYESEISLVDRHSIRLLNGEICDSNFITSFSIFPTVLAVLRAYRYKNTLRGFYLCISVVCVVFILMSGSRGALISLLVGFMGLFLQVMLTKEVKNTRKIVLVCVLVLFAFLFLIFAERILPSSTYNRLFNENYVESAGGSVRLDAWIFAINLMDGKWLFGNGIIPFSRFYVNVYGLSQDVHNTFLRILFMMGLVGVVPVLLYFGWLLHQGRGNKSALIIGLTLMVIIVNCFISSVDKLPFWFEIMAITVYANYANRSKTEIYRVL